MVEHQAPELSPAYTPGKPNHILRLAYSASIVFLTPSVYSDFELEVIPSALGVA